LLVYPAIYAFWREASAEPEVDGALKEENSVSTSTYLELIQFAPAGSQSAINTAKHGIDSGSLAP